MDYNETLCKSIDIIAKGLIEKIPYNKIIEGIILKEEIELDDINSKYFIDFNRTYFYAIGKKSNYKPGDSVYILIPQGDFDLQKIILIKKYTE